MEGGGILVISRTLTPPMNGLADAFCSYKRRVELEIIQSVLSLTYRQGVLVGPQKKITSLFYAVISVQQPHPSFTDRHQASSGLAWSSARFCRSWQP